MTVKPLDTDPENRGADLAASMLDMAKRARAAFADLAKRSPEARTSGLKAMARGVRAARDEILAANASDLELGRARGLSPAMMDRLALDPQRVESIADAVDAIAALDDPLGQERARWTRPNGLEIARVSCPLGVIGIIYEGRPNVTADAAAVCLRSGNAAILRCGSESLATSRAMAGAMRQALRETGLAEDAVQLVDTRDRGAVGHMLDGMGGRIDVVVPRGGRSLVERVQAEARIPVIGHLEGLCHMYLDASADPDKARELVINAKMRRTGICGALETLLIDQTGADALLPALAQALGEAGCELRGDAHARAILPAMAEAGEADWRTEYLAPILSVGVVDGLDGALAHIARYGSGHTDAIVAEDEAVARRFLGEVDSAIVMHNASTQFADGGEFGMGAEIGIATGRIHARGPVGAEQLTTFKYVVHGDGQTRA